MDHFQISKAIRERTFIDNGYEQDDCGDDQAVTYIAGTDNAAAEILAMHNQEVAALKERIIELEDTIRGEMSTNEIPFKIL